MQGSFVRRGVQARRDPGTRPGLHGQTLISTGLSDLDVLLEGGLPLGTVVLVLEDPHSQQHNTFIKYFLSEGIACGQKAKLILPREPAGGVAKFLPAQQTASSGGQASHNAYGGGEDDSDDESKGQAELRIAWQYRKYIKGKQAQEQQQQESQRVRPATGPRETSTSSSRPALAAASSVVHAGATRAWSHQFDLRRSLGAEALHRSGLAVIACAGPECWSSISDQACNFISEFSLPESTGSSAGILARVLLKGPEGVGRLVLQGLGSPSWRWPSCPQPALEAALLRCVLSVHHAVRDTRCAVMISCPAGMLSHSTQMRLQHMCDYVLLLQSVSDTSDVVRLLADPTTASALLAIRKLADSGMVAPRLPDPNLYVIRHRRKTISIQMVDVDPDAEASMERGAAIAGKSGKPASAMLCAGPPKANKALDF